MDEVKEILIKIQYYKIYYYIFRDITGRFVLLLGICTRIEFLNCLMYIRDIFPYIDNCIFMCLIPMFINSVTEILFIGYMNLMRIRLKKINEIINKMKI